MNRDREHGVGTTGMIVELRRGDLPPVAALREQCERVGSSPDRRLLQALNDDTFLARVVEQLEVGLLRSILMHAHSHRLTRPGWRREFRCQEVAKLLVVQLHEGNLDAEVCRRSFQLLEQLKKCTGDHSCLRRRVAHRRCSEVSLHCMAA